LVTSRRGALVGSSNKAKKKTPQTTKNDKEAWGKVPGWCNTRKTGGKGNKGKARRRGSKQEGGVTSENKREGGETDPLKSL